MKKKLTYIAQVYYLDAALEYIQELSKIHELHVVIELTNDSKNANILDLNIDLNKYDNIVDFKAIQKEWGLEALKPYFEDCLSVQFLIFKSKKSLSVNSLLRSITLIHFLKKTKSNFYHFDDYSLRLIGLLPFLFFRRKKLILNVHDPLPHLGEFDFKKSVLKKIIFFLFRRFVVFSTWSRKLMDTQIKSTQNVYQIPLLPYTFYRNFLSPEKSIDSKKITFIGRLSKYKGIDLFIDAIGCIHTKYPNQHFTIAGKPHPNYQLTEKLKESNFLSIELKHLSSKEMVDIVMQSKVIVCPYIEATQSGVIMTAYALAKPVIVTNVGGLPEYVLQNKTGLICEPNPESLAKAIEKFIEIEPDNDFSFAINKYSYDLKLNIIEESKNIYN